MKTTVDIPKSELEDAIRFSGGKTKREAILAALESYNRRHRMAELVIFSGKFSSLMTNDEIEAADQAKHQPSQGDTHA